MEVSSPVQEDKKKMYGKYDEYEIKDAVRTLMEAEEIKADSEKMKYVKQCIEKKKKAINSIADIKAAYKEKSMEDES